MYDEIMEYLKTQIAELGFDENEILEDTYIRKELGLDSSEVVEISLHIKKDYNIDIDLKDDMCIKEIVDKILGGKTSE